MKLEAAFLIVAAAGCILYAAGCATSNRAKNAPYIAQRASDGLWVYRLDSIAGVTHESALRYKDAESCLHGYKRFRAMLENGCEPIIRTDSNRATLERWHIEDGQGATVDNAEQGFATPSDAKRNFETVKRAVLACPDPVINYGIKL